MAFPSHFSRLVSDIIIPLKPVLISEYNSVVLVVLMWRSF
jgi:hypothetical protein